MARLRRVVIEEDPGSHVADLGRYRLRFSDEAWSVEAVNALTDADVLRELERLDAERDRPEERDGAA